MLKLSAHHSYLCLFILSFLTFSQATCAELKSEKHQFSIIYEDKNHKFLAQSLFNILEAKTPKWNKQLQLSPINHINIFLCNNELDIQAQKLPFDAYFIPNNKEKIFLLIENNKPIDSVQNWYQILFYQWSKCLFRQNKIPNHILFESSYLVWLTHQYIGWGESSLPFSLSTRTPFVALKNEIASAQNWYEPKLILESQLSNDMESIKNFSLFLILYKSEKNNSLEFFHSRAMNELKNYKPWQEFIVPEKWNTKLINEISDKRDVYNHHLQNFNYPRNNLTWDKEATSIIREVIRIHKNAPELAKTIFKHLALYPSKSEIFCEFGIFLNPKEFGMSEHLLWLEYYLLNHTNNHNMHLTDAANLEKLIASFPEKELINDQIKLLQFMTYFGLKQELKIYLETYNILESTNTVLLNHAYAIEILLQTKNIKSLINNKFKYTPNLLWPTIQKIVTK